MNHTLLSIILIGILSIVVNSSAHAHQTPQITGAGISYGMEQNTLIPGAVLSPVRDHHHWGGAGGENPSSLILPALKSAHTGAVIGFAMIINLQFFFFLGSGSFRKSFDYSV